MNKPEQHIYLVEERLVGSEMNTARAAEPVLVSELNEDVKKELVKRFNRYGFVIFENDKQQEPNQLIQHIAKELNLGETYVTGNNKKKYASMFSKDNLNTITSSKTSTHVVFDNSNAQGLHSDATFEPIGTVPSTILYCVQEAMDGGDTILFDSVSAFHLLHQFNPKWAEAMLHPESLRRYSGFNDGVEYVDAAFKQLPNGEIISRFTVDSSCDWEYGFERVPYLREAFGFLCALIPNGSDYSTVLRLKSNQGILFANDKIAHGRTSFVDNPESEHSRKMIRGLYLERPTL